MQAPTTHSEDQLDLILAEYLRTVQAGSAPSRTHLLAQYPEYADELREFFADRDAVERVAAPLRRAVSAVAEFQLPRVFGHYRLVEELGRGGMGIVYRAEDLQLGRQVALKILLHGPLASAEDRLRLRLEAEAVSRLGYHPHIVPVLEVGDAEGHAYLTMQLIEGSTLSAFKEHFRRHPRAIACLLSTLAETVHHAHLHGITHRDLKPSNILMARLGDSARSGALESVTPVVSDFGLARVPSLTATQRPTLSGAILGTPAYMAPEQAHGGECTLAVDVYGLGAILYELLTQRPPQEGSPLEILRRLGEQDPVAPRRHDPTIPLDLEKICQKCLARTPADRYETARDLADDLQRFLNGEPVLARPVGSLTRAARWARRQPLSATLLVCLVLALVGGSVVSTLLWLRAEANYQTAEAALLQAEVQQRRAEAEAKEAEANFALAHDVVRDFCLDFAAETERVGGLQPATRDLLERALGYYDQFLKRHADDPRLWSELAATQALVGRIRLTLVQRAEGLAALREARALHERLHQHQPEDIRWMRGLVGAITNLGITEATTAQTSQALEEALDLTEKFLLVHPKDVDLRMGKGHTLTNQGALFERRGERLRARQCYEQASEHLRKLNEEHPDHPSIQRDLAYALTNLAGLRSHDPDGTKAALAAFAQARELREKLVRRSPGDPRRQADLAQCLHKQAIVLREDGQLQKAQAGFVEAMKLWQSLVDENPAVVDYQASLASTLKQIAFNLARENRARAIEPYQRAVAMLESVVKAAPQEPEHRRELGLTLYSLGCTHGALNQRPEERAAFERGELPLRWLVNQDRENIDARHYLARLLHNLAFNLSVTNQREKAIEKVNEAIGHTRAALERAPEHLPFRQLLDVHHLLLAEIHWKQGQVPESVAAIQARLALWPANGERLFHGSKELARLLAVANLTPELEQMLWKELEATLKAASEAGFTSWDRVQQEAEFAPLRTTPRLQKALEQLRPTSPCEINHLPPPQSFS